MLRPALDDLSWSLLDATLTQVAQPVLARTAQLATRHQATLTAEHQRLLAALNAAIAGPPKVDVIDQLRDIPLHLP